MEIYINPLKARTYSHGDRIIQVNDKVIRNSNDLSSNIMIYEGEQIKIVYIRDESIFEEYITPVLSKEDNFYHIGLWIKDGAIGIGTISFYNKEDNKYAALGHGITDVDTGKLVEINDGDIIKTDIVSIAKGKTSTPGQIKGVFLEETNYGNVKRNCSTGVYGNYTTINAMDKYKNGINIAPLNEIKTGEATILSTIDNQIKEYKVKIKKVYKLGSKDNKNMVVEIVDKELLERTGGIIQGMSGSPIIQNNRLVGALTHVFVNDPTQGYAIFAETMVKTINNME